MKHIPVLGRVYRESEYISIAGERISDISLTSYPLIKTSSELFTKILGNDIYNPQTYSDQIKAGLGSVYQNILILEADTKDATARKLVSGAYVSGKVDFEKIKNISQQGDHLLSELPSILGKGKKQTYLILFQNNMELRPTGGFIGSYAVSTFDGGRMSELNINDVYSADGQLRGHVDPPDAIKNYLGEANWWLRDSNWDPDFPTSAKRAEWFLDKEVDTQVDGVISIDLSLVRDLLKYTGSIFLPDYNLDITSENLYERTQAEVLDNFFPGSRKKASFLTALSRNLLTELGKISGRSRFYTLKAIFDNLEKRHVQVFLHNDVGQNAISLLGWSGEVGSPDCGDGCYLDLVAPVEANVGVNKANYFVKRSVSLNVNYANGVVERALTLNLKNSANTALGASGKYKAYIRVLVPADSEVVSVRSILGQSVQVLNPEVVENKGRKEIGVLIETVGGQSHAIDLIWRSSLPPGDSAYQLYFRKQAGVEDYPLTLTINGAPVYNTTLSRDIWTRKY